MNSIPLCSRAQVFTSLHIQERNKKLLEMCQLQTTFISYFQVSGINSPVYKEYHRTLIQERDRDMTGDLGYEYNLFSCLSRLVITFLLSESHRTTFLRRLRKETANTKRMSSNHHSSGNCSYVFGAEGVDSATGKANRLPGSPLSSFMPWLHTGM